MIEQLYQYSQKEDKGWSLRQLCQWLGVNRAWYYSRKELKTRWEQTESELKKQVEELLTEFAGYGYRRVTAALKQAGVVINHKKVLRLLREWGLLCRPFHKKKVVTTQADPTAPNAANLLKPIADKIERPNVAWVGDVLYLHTKTESGFLATLLDAFSRKCIGWAISPTNDTALTKKALERAISTRQPKPGLIHHTDRGSNYTSEAYRQRLTEIGAKVSHSRPGCPQENGMAESFNKTARYERLYLTEYTNLTEVEADLDHWLDNLYNQRPLHSALGYLSPVQYELLYINQTIPTSA
jgi:transposase InsO family protein